MNPWIVAAPLIARAVERQDTHSLEDVEEAIRKGEAQLWCFGASALVTEIHVYPRKKVCRIWMAAGVFEELVRELLPAVEGWAREKGCQSVTVVGRPGWARVMKDYHQPHTMLEKEL